MLLMMAAGAYMKGGTAASAEEEDTVDGLATAPIPRFICAMVSPHYLADLVRRGMDKVLLIDSRSFLEYNTIHIAESINVYCSKIVKRRLQQDKLSVQELLSQACPIQTDETYEIIVYDQCSIDPSMLTEDCFLYILLKKLVKVFRRVSLLKGGFLEFQATHPSLCESNSSSSLSSSGYKCPPLTSMSQPCLPVSNIGPTKILPFLYLGSQHDALRQDVMQKNGINYLLNVSNSCPKPNFIQDSHFLRIPVNDNYNDKLLPFFHEAFQFLEKVRSANGCVLVHCLAGISRSPTLAIAYLMGYLGMSTDEAYKYVKDKRPTISPNFNFLGQLLEYENQLKATRKEAKEDMDNKISLFSEFIEKPLPSPAASPKTPVRPRMSLALGSHLEATSVQSPTSALAKLNFSQTPTETTPESEIPFPQIPTSNLGTLSFTPCFATSDPTDATSTVRMRNKRQGGVKRPYSTSTLENCLPSEFAKNFRDSHSGESSYTAGTSIQTSAYSALPSLDSLPSGVSEEKPSSLWAWIPPREDESPHEKMDCTTSGSPSKQEVNIAETPPSLSPSAPASSVCKPKRPNIMRPTVLGGSIGSSRKARSLENIIRCKDEVDFDYSSIDRRLQQHAGAHVGCAPVGTEMITHTPAVESMQCQHCASADTQYQSNSSISSSGSHNSLHDTLEIIPVS